MKVFEATEKDVITVKRSLSLRGLLELFKEFHASPVIPVVDDDGKLLGVVNSENLLDLLRPPQTKLFRNIPFIEVDENIFDLEPVPSMGDLIIVDDIMNKNFICVKDCDTLEDAYKTMRLHKREWLPVVTADGKLNGVVGIFDIIWQMFKEKKIV